MILAKAHYLSFQTQCEQRLGVLNTPSKTIDLRKVAGCPQRGWMCGAQQTLLRSKHALQIGGWCFEVAWPELLRHQRNVHPRNQGVRVVSAETLGLALQNLRPEGIRLLEASMFRVLPRQAILHAPQVRVGAVPAVYALHGPDGLAVYLLCLGVFPLCLLLSPLLLMRLIIIV